MRTAIPQLERGQDTTLQKPVQRSVLEAKIKVIDKRRAEIEAKLATNPPEYESQELHLELQGLNELRLECDEVLNPRPKERRHPALAKAYAEQRERDIHNLRGAIKHHTENATWAAEQEERAGNFRSARLHRMTIPDIPEACWRAGLRSQADREWQISAPDLVVPFGISPTNMEPKSRELN